MPAPYIHFNDCCREAMAFYQNVFGGTLDIMTFDDMPDAPAELAASDRVMHATLTTDKGPIFASDAFPGSPTPPSQASMSISWDTDSPGQGQEMFDKLAEGGEIVMPYAATFFSPGFGMVKDRFGTHWMIMTYQEA